MHQNNCVGMQTLIVTKSTNSNVYALCYDIRNLLYTNAIIQFKVYRIKVLHELIPECQ